MNLEESTILALAGKLDEAKGSNKQEARSHKEDNERVAPREQTVKVFGEIDNVPKRARFNGKNGWGNMDAREIEDYENGIGKDITLYKDLKGYAKDDKETANAYANRASHWDARASELVKNKARQRNELQEGKLLMTGYEAGMCPKCKKPIFNYEDIEWFDDSIGQSFICNNCNLKGTEYYNISFDCIELEKPELEESENVKIDDKVNSRIQQVRDRIAKSKENSKK